jgi:membrane protein DedA with SNARE-associated domain
MVLLIRFAPGLRVAIAAACAYVDVPPLRFSILNSITAVIWAVGLLVVVGWAGPAGLAQFGLGGWRGALLVGLIVLGVFKVVSRYERAAVDEAAGSGDRDR